MSRVEQVEALVSELGAQLGLPELRFDETGRIALQVGEAPVTLLYQVEPLELIWLYCGLGDLPDESEATGALLLRANARTWTSSGVSIGIDEQGKRALGFLPLPVGSLTAAGLREALTVLLEASLPIRGQLAAGDAGADAAGEDDTQLPGGLPPQGMRV